MIYPLRMPIFQKQLATFKAKNGRKSNKKEDYEIYVLRKPLTKKLFTK